MILECDAKLGGNPKNWHRVKLKSEKNILILIDEHSAEDISIDVFIDGKNDLKHQKGIKINLRPLEPLNLKIKENFNED